MLSIPSLQAGRVTLERAIAMVNSHPTWNARVVYGDTDRCAALYGKWYDPLVRSAALHRRLDDLLVRRFVQHVG